MFLLESYYVYIHHRDPPSSVLNNYYNANQYNRQLLSYNNRSFTIAREYPYTDTVIFYTDDVFSFFSFVAVISHPPSEIYPGRRSGKFDFR